MLHSSKITSIAVFCRASVILVMCELLTKTLGLPCSVLNSILLLYIAGVVTAVLIYQLDQDDKLENAIAWALSHASIIDLAPYKDISHVPSDPTEFYLRPNSGNCCNNMCAGDRCLIGDGDTKRPDHCNNCCFHLRNPGSCTNHVCTCYTNDQSERNRSDRHGGTTTLQIK
jgi:hypothetical protein